MTSQTQRVFNALLRAGPLGITQADFLHCEIPITRLAARIHELRNRGIVVLSPHGQTRNGFQVYVMPGAPVIGEQCETAGALFTPPPVSPYSREVA